VIGLKLITAVNLHCAVDDLVRWQRLETFHFHHHHLEVQPLTLYSLDFTKLSHKIARREKCIPQFNCTHYLGVFYKVHSTTLSSQTLDVVPVERFQIHRVLAPRLLALHGQTGCIRIQANSHNDQNQFTNCEN